MSLDLSARQRAMLLEMNIRVWTPTATASPAQPSTPQAATVQAPIRPTPSMAVPTAAPVRMPPMQAPADAPAQRVDVGDLDWRALQEAVAQCRACSLCRTRHQTVFGVGGGADTPDSGAPRADWLIVGEAPGEQEDLQGEPFVGKAGQLLDNMLAAMGLSRRTTATATPALTPLREVYIANVLKCRPPGNRNPDPVEVSQCQPYLQRQIALLQPKLILAMGRFAAQTLLAETIPDVQTMALGKLRGRVHRYRSLPVVVTYHPAYLLRAPAEKAKSWADLCLALDTAKQMG